MLTLGIITSMFTAITVTRAMVNLAFGGRNLKKLSGMSEAAVRVINFMGLAQATARCSRSSSSLISIVSLATAQGLNFGLDFTGGTLVEVAVRRSGRCRRRAYFAGAGRHQRSRGAALRLRTRRADSSAAAEGRIAKRCSPITCAVRSTAKYPGVRTAAVRIRWARGRRRTARDRRARDAGRTRRPSWST